MIGCSAPGAEVACRDYRRPRDLTDSGSIPGLGATAPDKCGRVGECRCRQCGSPWCVGGTAPHLVTHSPRRRPEPLGGLGSVASWPRAAMLCYGRSCELAHAPCPHRLVVRTSRRGRDNPGSNPGEDRQSSSCSGLGPEWPRGARACSAPAGQRLDSQRRRAAHDDGHEAREPRSALLQKHPSSGHPQRCAAGEPCVEPLPFTRRLA